MKNVHRLTAIVMVFILCLTMSLGVVFATEVTESTNLVDDPLPLEQDSFLETICGMFNCVFIPDGLASSTLSSWEDSGLYSSEFKILLYQLEYQYYLHISEYGYTTDDSTSDTYVRPYLYGNGDTSLSSVYAYFIEHGCLDFVSEGALTEREFNLIRASFNDFFKLMYDYNYTLGDYSIDELSKSIPKIRIYHRSIGNYTPRACYIGYNFPCYYQSSSSVTNWGYNNAISAAQSWIASYSEDGFGVEDYIAFISTADPQESAPASMLHLYYNILGRYPDSDVNDTGFTLSYMGSIGTRGGIRVNLDTQHTIYEFTQSYDSDYTITNSNTTLVQSAASYDLEQQTVFVSPMLKSYDLGYYYTYGSVSNWGTNLITGSHEMWLDYCSYEDDCLGVYSAPSESKMNEIIAFTAQDLSCEVAVDSILGVDTSGEVSEDSGTTTDPDSTDPTEDDSLDDLLNGGDYSDASDGQSKFDDVLKDYEDAESQLQDFTNLDDVITTYFNVGNLVENATNISTVSTYFMTIWDSFGPFGILFSLALALGLATFLLKI